MNEEKREFYAKQPKKRSAGGVLLFNENNELLVVKPNYKDHWMVVGGLSESQESPLETCIRETKEEIGIEKHPERLLCVDYVQNKELGDEMFTFFFFGYLSSEEIDAIVLQQDELDEYRFVSRDMALELVGGRGRRRLPSCFKAIDDNITYYLENGELKTFRIT